ncbi:MAG: LysE family translocator [Trueperaceae bacterium]|nr:LysE family translocator [Trueperaceae bacterium]
MLSTEFFLTSLIVVLIPGTGAIYTLSTGLFLGRRASIIAALGCTAGIVPHLLASILGISFILHKSALIFQGLKWLGVAYLLYLAWQMWRDRESLSFSDSGQQQNHWQIIRRAVFINLLNPKLTLFFFAFLPLFIDSSRTSVTLQMLYLSAVFMLITFIVFALYGFLASTVRKQVLSTPNVVVGVRRVFALLFAALGLKLALSS